jgi:tetratricopeptide (TPR) repeat protein
MDVLPERHGCDEWSTRAKEKEKRCDWFSAAVDYRKSVGVHLAAKNFLRAGEVQERIGLCLHRAAFQAETLKEFQVRIKTAVDAYQRGVEIFGKMGDPQREARMSSCKAKGTYVKLWIEGKASAKRRLLRRCCVLAKKALDVYKRAGNRKGFARVCNDLVVYLDERLRLESRKDVSQKLLREADSYCERAIEASSAIGDEYEIARAYYNAGHHFYVSVFLRPLNGKTEKNRQKALGYLQRAIELFKKMGETYLSVLASLDFGLAAYCRITMEPKPGIEHFKLVSKHARRTRDNYVRAWASFWLGFNSWWLMRLEQDPEKKRQLYHKCVRNAKKTSYYSSCVSDDCGIAFGCWLQSYAKHAFAEDLETRPNMRRFLLEESISISRKGVEHAECSGVLEAVHFTKSALCLALLFFSEVEKDIDKKRSALREALEKGEECVKAAKAGVPYDLWNLGINECFLALILVKLAEMEMDRERINYLRRNASLYWTKGKKSALEYLALYPDPKRYWGLGGVSFLYGESLSRLYHLTGRKDILPEVIKVYSESVSMFSQVGLSNMVAQAQWQIARTLDLQGRFSNAAMYFDRASRSFSLAAEETPLLKYWYMDSAFYMLAWKEIEDAKLCSRTMDHYKSADHYRKASTYLKETLKWRFLSPYYLALSLVELGKHLRKRKELEEANRTFQEAATIFEQAKILLKTRKGFAESSEEREEILKLGRIADVKRKLYARRLAMEEAKVLRALPDHPERAAGLNAFKDACIRARITAPKSFAIGREVRIGVDLVNIGRKPGVVVRIEKLVPHDLSVLEMPPSYTLEGESLNTGGKLLGPLQTISFSVKVRPMGFDAIELAPRVVYVNYHGDFVVYDVEPVLMRPLVTFESKPAYEVFTYLVSAFKEDHVKRGMPVEKSGWRTRTQILRGAKGLHKRHVYGSRGQLGPIILRLRNRGLIDIEVVAGRRSRGGRLTKIRIAYEKGAVKRYVAKENDFCMNRGALKKHFRDRN